jgi:hypothetical protein
MPDGIAMNRPTASAAFPTFMLFFLQHDATACNPFWAMARLFLQ